MIYILNFVKNFLTKSYCPKFCKERVCRSKLAIKGCFWPVCQYRRFLPFCHLKWACSLSFGYLGGKGWCPINEEAACDFTGRYWSCYLLILPMMTRVAAIAAVMNTLFHICFSWGGNSVLSGWVGLAAPHLTCVRYRGWPHPRQRPIFSKNLDPCCAPVLWLNCYLQLLTTLTQPDAVNRQPMRPILLIPLRKQWIPLQSRLKWTT